MVNQNNNSIKFQVVHNRNRNDENDQCKTIVKIESQYMIPIENQLIPKLIITEGPWTFKIPINKPN